MKYKDKIGDVKVNNSEVSGNETGGENKRLIYNFCDNDELLRWVEKYDYKQYFSISKEDIWNYRGWSYNNEYDVVPDAETAYAIADILLRNRYKENPYIKL